MTLESELRAEIARLETVLAERKAESQAREDQLQAYAADLRETYKQQRARSYELRESYRATVRALASAVEARDAYTGRHAERVAAYGLTIAAQMDPELVADPQTEFGFLLHDIGKVAIPDAILYKPGGLTSEEVTLMRRHPMIGWHILRDIGFLSHAKQVVRHHHERWDGRGYPDSRGGDEIPLLARIFSVADALDAITSDRPYRPASTLSTARDEIAAEAGAQFDPEVVEALDAVPDDSLDAIRQVRAA